MSFQSVKGSWSRVKNTEQYNKNYDRIFRRSSTKTNKKGTRK